MEAILTNTGNRVRTYFLTRLSTPQDGFQNSDKVYCSVELKHIAVPEWQFFNCYMPIVQHLLKILGKAFCQKFPGVKGRFKSSFSKKPESDKKG